MPQVAYLRREREVSLEPLLRLLLERRRAGGTVIAGIQGGQGTGKTTLVRYLSERLAEEGCSAVSFSIDDFYADREERRRLAEAHPGNPYYRLPRGMPGTHRTRELERALAALKAGEDLELPVFEKSAGGGEGEISERSRPVRGRRDFVLFEGWCLGIPEASPEELESAARKHGLPPVPPGFEAVLARCGGYHKLWGMLDLLIMLYPDRPELHENWRLEQERKLIERRGTGLDEDRLREMVRLFLPFTYLCYEKLQPDLRLHIDHLHRFYRVSRGPL